MKQTKSGAKRNSPLEGRLLGAKRTIVYLQAGNEVHTGDLYILCSIAEGN